MKLATLKNDTRDGRLVLVDRSLAHAARTRRLVAGTIVGSGAISNRDPAAGSACLEERRMIEIIADGKPATEFLKFGDRVEISVDLPEGGSLFGPISQKVVRYTGP